MKLQYIKLISWSRDNYVLAFGLIVCLYFILIRFAFIFIYVYRTDIKLALDNVICKRKLGEKKNEKECRE